MFRRFFKSMPVCFPIFLESPPAIAVSIELNSLFPLKRIFTIKLLAPGIELVALPTEMNAS